MLARTVLVLAMIGAAASPALAAGNMTARNRATLPAAAASQPSGELNMIQLQSLMSQRQQAVQLTTNLVRATSNNSRTVAGNIGK